jgi:hypothetical protein
VPGYFIDTSALAKPYHAEVGSQQMEMLEQSQDNCLIVSQLSVIELQSVFAAEVGMGVMIKEALISCVAYFSPTLPLADSRWFCCPVVIFEVLTG